MAAYEIERRLGERLADRTDPAVHHVARGDRVRPGLDVAGRRAREQLERLVVLHDPVHEDAAVAVRGVLAQADVRDEHELRLIGGERPERLLDDPVLDPRARALVVLLLWDSEQQHGLDPERGKLAGLRHEILH